MPVACSCFEMRPRTFLSQSDIHTVHTQKKKTWNKSEHVKQTDYLGSHKKVRVRFNCCLLYSSWTDMRCDTGLPFILIDIEAFKQTGKSIARDQHEMWWLMTINSKLTGHFLSLIYELVLKSNSKEVLDIFHFHPEFNFRLTTVEKHSPLSSSLFSFDVEHFTLKLGSRLAKQARKCFSIIITDGN